MKEIKVGDVLKGLHPIKDLIEDGVVEAEKQVVSVLDVQIEITHLNLVSLTDGEFLANHRLTKQNFRHSFDQYKKKVGLLTSDEIMSIRKKRGWSQEQMAKFLDIGLKDITRYENGSIQTKAIDNMIRIIANDKIFYEMANYLNKLSFAE